MRVLEQLEAPWLVAGDTMKLYIRDAPEALERYSSASITSFSTRQKPWRWRRSTPSRRPRINCGIDSRCVDWSSRKGRTGPPSTVTAKTFTSRPCQSTRRPTRPAPGDAVAAGFLGALAEQQVETDDSVRLALGYAMVMASFAIQHFSVKGLQPITRADVEARMASMAWQVQPTG